MMSAAMSNLSLGMTSEGPGKFPESPLSRAWRQPLMLGVFLPLSSGGWSVSTLPRSTSWSFEYNAELLRCAESLGFDLAFGASEWLSKGGFGGKSCFHAIALDPFITASALAPLTARIILISTVHILYGPWHPLTLAKMGATLDHISGGRWGINVVTGHRAREHRRFGINPIEHDQRYVMAEEFISLTKALWQCDNDVTREGRHWNMKDAYVGVRPTFDRPIIVTATGSDAGIDFASRHSDIVFTSSLAGAEIETALEQMPARTNAIKRKALSCGRRVSTLINPMVVCRSTDAEAREYRDAIVNAADVDAYPGFAKEESDAQGYRGHSTNQRALGGNIQLVGSPTTIVDYLRRLNAAGIDGVQLSFFDFLPDLRDFGEHVLPLLHQAGLRL
jgi:dimethylsulfone monooxygenase